MSEIFTAVEKATRATETQFPGKFRAIVVDTEDPQAMGRVKLSIPDVLGDQISEWAMPIVPYGGGAQYGFFAVPPVKSAVIAEFLNGDRSQPIYTGTFWRTPDEVPELDGTKGVQEQKILQTESSHILAFNDTEGEEAITLRSSAEAEMVLDHEGSFVLADKNGSTVKLDAAGGELTVADSNGNSMVMSSSGITCKDAAGNEITTSGSGIEIKASAVVNIEGSMVTVAGAGGEPLIKGSTFLSMFNTHTHNATSLGAPTTPPLVPLTPAVLTTKSTAS